MKRHLVEMAANIVAANSSGRGFPTEIITDMLSDISHTIKRLEMEEDAPSSQITLPAPEPTVAEPGYVPPADWKKSFGVHRITCLICGYSGKVLGPHLRMKHAMTARDYRKQFNIPSKTGLSSKVVSTKRKEIAKEIGAGKHLAEGRKKKQEAAAQQTS